MRKLPCSGLAGFDESLKRIKEEFGLEWLESHQAHPLKELWIRSDVFASIQLHQFGYSLQKIKDLNVKWFTEVIKIIKGDEPGRRRGAVLEVLAASQLHSPPERIVELPRIGKQGYDIKVKLNSGYEIYYQVKNNTRSEEYYKIEEKARSVEKILVANLDSIALHVFIKRNTDPRDGDWFYLEEQLPLLMEEASSEVDIIRDIDGGWMIRIYRLHASGGVSLHPSRATYIMQLLTPILKQERDGMYTDITDACNALMEPDTDKSLNIALICIPLDAPFALCGKWIKEYFIEFPYARVSGVLLYKPGDVSDLERDENCLSHAYHLILKEDRADWIEALSLNHLDLVVGRGSVSVEGKSNLDNYNLLYGGETREKYIGHHVYQFGSENYVIKANGEYMITPHYGISLHVFYDDSDRKEKEISFDLQQDQDLVLLR